MLKLASFSAWLLLAVFCSPLSAAENTMSLALHQAAAADDVAAIETLIAAGAPVDARDGTGATALLVATHGNRLAAARALIAAGADVNAKDGIDDSPYLYAGARGHLEILS